MGSDIENIAKNGDHSKGNHYLLLIAINDYQKSDARKPFNSLNNAVQDAKKIKTILLDKYKFNETSLGDDIPTELFDSDASWDNIDEALDDIKAKMTEDDSLLVYFAGHGHVDDNGSGYLIPYEGDTDSRRSWYKISDIADKFDKYTQNKICKHLLLILDCCYAGSAFLGRGEGEAGDFSRYVITSALHDEKATDGLPGRGSPFAAALCNLLEQNITNNYHINAGNLESEFKRVLEGQSIKQKIKYGALPGENGQGKFLFRLKSKSFERKLLMETFCQTLVKHLDFHNQRDDLLNFYSQKNPNFKIISTCGTSIYAHDMLNQICLNHVESKQNKLITTSLDHWPVNITKTLSEEVFSPWNHLKRYKELEGKEGSPEVKAKLIDIIVQDLTEGQAIQKQQNLIISFTIEAGSEDMLKAFEPFLKEFNTLFQTKINNLDAAAKPYLGYLFIMVSDRREDVRRPFFDPEEAEEEDDFDVFFAEKYGPGLNFIPTSKIKRIKKSHVEDWIDDSKSDMLHNKLWDSNYFKTLEPDHFLEQDRFKIDEFFDCILKYMEKIDFIEDDTEFFSILFKYNDNQFA